MPSISPYVDTFATIAPLDRLPKVFVVGCAKSGTTWVRNILNGHPAIVVDGEGGFGWRLLPELAAAVRRFNQHQAQHAHPQHTMVSDDEFKTLFRFAVLQRLAAYLDRSGKDPAAVRLIGDKTPQHTVVLAQLAAAFPEAKFVHVVRDPRDVVTSAWFHFEQGGREGGKTFEQHAEAFVNGPWKVGVGAALAAERALGSKLLHMRYESLHDDATGEVLRLLTFLDMQADDATVQRCVDAGSFERASGGRRQGEEDTAHFYRKGACNDWLNHMDADTAARICRDVAPLMERFGYDPSGSPAIASERCSTLVSGEP
ncbi:MAG: sulfotransferase [Phycisphaerales bacterium]|nr:sulfotransferase [Phycisphaerales bacterium]